MASLSSRPHDLLFEAAAGKLLSLADLEAARAERQAAGAEVPLVEILLRDNRLSLRRANQILSSTHDRVVLCPDCGHCQLLEWHRCQGTLLCMGCKLELPELRRELCLPDLGAVTAAPEYGPSLVGRIDGVIHIRRRLAEGRYSGWYSGEKRYRKEAVVLCEVAPDIQHDAAALAALKRKFEVIKRLIHPARPTSIDLVQVEERWFVLESPLEGPSVADLLAKVDRLPTLDMLRVMTPIAAAMREAHSRGLTGFALFPELIVLDGHTEPRLIDFATGFLRRRTPGQVAYWPPESLDGVFDARTDVYNFCGICRFLLMGEPPFRADTIEELEALIRSGERRSLLEARPDLHPELATLLEAGLSPDPAKRPQSMEQVARQVEIAQLHHRWLAENQASSQKAREAEEARAAAPPAAPPTTEPASAAPPSLPPDDPVMQEITELKRRIKEHITHRRLALATKALRRILEFEGRGEAYAREVTNARALLDKLRANGKAGDGPQLSS